MMTTMKIIVSLFLVVLAPLLAFVPSQQQGITTTTTATTRTFSSSSSFSSTALSMAAVRTPELTKWKTLKNGGIKGTIKFHPEIKDGKRVETSPLANQSAVGPNKVVSTKSGSKYKLVGPSTDPLPSSPVTTSAKKSASTAAAAASVSSTNNKAATGGGGFSFFGGGSSSGSGSAAAPASKKAMEQSKKPEVSKAPSKSRPTLSVQLFKRKEQKVTDITIGNGAYILAGVSSRSTSGKSNIWRAYKANGNGQPTGPELIAKLSANYDALSRESSNYNKVATGLLSGAFVKKYAFLEYADASKVGFDDQSILIIDAGMMDMKEYLKLRKLQPLTGKAMRDAAAAAGQCVQAMHSSRMVWTDLKTENFVLMQEPTSEGDITVRAIDLESAQPYGDSPSDFSPEACPPEFAAEYLAGNGAEFKLDPTYDMWSLGMYLYELATGKPYFYKKSETIMVTTLRRDDFEADVSDIEDPKLQDLVGKCLQRNPKKRPSITAFLLHPYFTTTGIGGWSF